MALSLSQVPHGPYFGFTKAELNAELTRYKTAVSGAGSELLGASVNGQSYTFGPRRDWSLAQWQEQLQKAMSLLDPERVNPVRNTMLVVPGLRDQTYATRPPDGRYL